MSLPKLAKLSMSFSKLGELARMSHAAHIIGLGKANRGLLKLSNEEVWRLLSSSSDQRE